jgi:hypothetical protein
MRSILDICCHELVANVETVQEVASKHQGVFGSVHSVDPP